MPTNRNAPHRFRVTLGAENTRFDSKMYIDFVYIEGQPVLHMVDEATRVPAAPFVSPITTESVLETILKLWANICTDIPSKLVFDEGSQFRDAFIEICDLHDVEWLKSGIQHHNAQGIGERYHAPMRKTYRKLKVEFPQMNKHLLLSMSVRAGNGTLGPDGIVPSVLVFGEFPTVISIRGAQVPRPTLTERRKLHSEQGN